jgi:hypothetical protein
MPRQRYSSEQIASARKRLINLTILGLVFVLLSPFVAIAAGQPGTLMFFAGLIALVLGIGGFAAVHRSF